MNNYTIPLYMILFLLTPSCTYLKYSSVQADYSRLQNADPSQMNLKHMLDRENFFIIGKTIDKSDIFGDVPLAVAAYSSKFKENERVDTTFVAGTGTHFGLNLPEGAYTILVYADKDGDKIYSSFEVVGRKEVLLNVTSSPDKVMSQVEIHLHDPVNVSWAGAMHVPKAAEHKESLYFPTGTIRDLDDPLFDEDIATLGMYDPAAFLEYTPTMFYALEEDLSYKIPVIFVHGIGGSSRSFEPIVNRLDRNRYKPWFFYYPSGGDLSQLADLFYDIFLSGDTVLVGDVPIIIVAHSMGGLVVREAFNNYHGKEGENEVKLLVTIASPLGGHPSAALGEQHGLIVLPAWRDLNPDSRFIKDLYLKPLPNFVEHQLFYAYNNTNPVKFGENSDGVVPLSSQLYPLAQKQSHQQFGFNSSHVGILENENMITLLLEEMSDVEHVFPESHMEVLAEGGFDVALGDAYTPHVKYVIQSAGKYLVSLALGILEPVNSEQMHFVRVANGEAAATNEIERAYISVMKEYPELAGPISR